MKEQSLSLGKYWAYTTATPQALESTTPVMHLIRRTACTSVGLIEAALALEEHTSTTQLH
jgi:hypothetical protein